MIRSEIPAKLLLSILPILFSCVNNNFTTDDLYVSVSIDCNASDGETKSIYTQEESYLADWLAIVYDSNGHLCGTLFSEDGGKLLLMRNKEYHIYAVGNIGRIQAPPTESELLDYKYSISSISSINKGGFPMSGALSGPIVFTNVNNAVTIGLTRAFAKYNLVIDDSELEYSSLELTSVEVKQGALDVSLFSDNSVPDKVSETDYASARDLQILNDGGYVSFYMLENCGGCLLSGNKDQWKKVPDSLGPEKEKLTYLELKGRWMSSGVSSDIVLRMYLGRDNCSDFNIDRNTVNNVQLTLSDQGLLQSDWRIYRYNVEDNRVLEFGQPTVELVSGTGVKTVGLKVIPSDVKFSVTVNSAEASNAGITYSYDNDQICLSSEYQGSGHPSAVFYLKTWDGVIKGNMTVNVRKPSKYEIGGLEDTYVIPQNTIRWPDVIFSQSVPSRSMLTLSSSDESVVKCVWDNDDDENPLGFKAIGPGFACLTIQYGDFTKKVFIYVTPSFSFTGLPDKYIVLDQGASVDYEVSPSPFTIIPGDFDVTAADPKTLSVANQRMAREYGFTSNGIVFGDFNCSVSFSLKGLKNGKTRLSCKTDYPIYSREMNAYVIGPGKTAVIRVSPSDGTSPTLFTSSGKDVVYNSDNNVACNVLISGDALITSVKFARAESTAYHSDMSLSERSVVQLCGKQYSLGQTVTDMDDLNCGEPFFVKGYDSIMEMQVTVGRSATPITLRFFFVND